MIASELSWIFGIAFVISFAMFIASLFAMGWLFNQLREAMSFAIEENEKNQRYLKKITEQEAVIHNLQCQLASCVCILNKQNGSK